MPGKDGSAPQGVPSEPVIVDTNDHGILPPGTGSAAADSTSTPSNKALVRSEVVRQVEFYFSDANLPTDEFLMKQIKRNAEGWVSIRVIADFRKIKKITKSFPTVLAALRTSTQLEISQDGHRVRRLAPLPEVDLDEIRGRTVITWNLPDKPTIEQVMEIFSKAGNVAMARIRKPEHEEPLLTKGLRTEVAKGAREYYALIEYATVEEANKAVLQLNDESDWRRGLRVRPLLAGVTQQRGTQQHAKQVANRGGSPVKKAAGGGGKTENNRGRKSTLDCNPFEKTGEGGSNAAEKLLHSAPQLPQLPPKGRKSLDVISESTPGAGGGNTTGKGRQNGNLTPPRGRRSLDLHPGGGLQTPIQGESSSSSSSSSAPIPIISPPLSHEPSSSTVTAHGSGSGSHGRRRSFTGGEEARPKAAWEQTKRKNKSEYAAWASAGAAAAAAASSSKWGASFRKGSFGCSRKWP